MASTPEDAAARKKAEDAASNERLMQALFSGDEEAETTVWKDPEIASHKQLDLDEDGQPLQLRFAYVDEVECIGCTYCASVARNTFFMEPDAGRARVFAQGQDEPELVMEAIECCPVNCISFVDHDDLVILENEREDEMILPTSIGGFKEYQIRGARTASKAKGGTSQVCCNNCPSRGCKECPMYGVGLNPKYMERQAEREKKREASGAAAKDRFDVAAKEKLDVLFSPTGAAQPASSSSDAAGAATASAGDDYMTTFDELIELEAPPFTYEGETMTFIDPDGERGEVSVPAWAATAGATFFVACNADGEWVAQTPEQVAALDAEAAAAASTAAAEEVRGVVQETKPRKTDELAMPSASEMEAEVEGSVFPTGGEVDVFAAIYSDVMPMGDLANPPLGLDDDDDDNVA